MPYLQRRTTKARSVLALLTVSALPVAGCAGSSGDGSDGDCADYPSDNIEFIVPYTAGGGFDTWVRVIAPVLAQELPNSINVPVANREGAGGITGVTELFGSPPDGTRLALTEPGILSTAQISGTTDTDFSELRAVGRATVEPEVIVVHADSEWNTIEDVQQDSSEDDPVLMGSGGLAAINIVSSDALGIPFDYVVHEGSSEALLSVIRQDTELALFPLSSVTEGIRGGDLKPLLVIGTPPEADHPYADAVEGVPTLDEVTGEDGLGAALEQHRIIVAPPETPDCIIEIQSEAIAATFENPDFLGQLDSAGLVPAHLDAAETQEILQNTIDTLDDYSELLIETFEN